MRDGSDGDKVIAQAAALRREPFKRTGNVLLCDELGLNEQIS